MNCDFCREDLTGQDRVDGKTVFGPWAIMCMICFKDKGVGLGLGKGQKYNKDGVKVAG